jgi:succinate dehydrogenase/fumarate reductase flavoprotein subunit
VPLNHEDGLPPNQVEYKIRRLVNDYLQPPKVTRKYEIAQRRFAEIRADLPRLVARDAHELMRALEVHSILDCADMAAAASLYRTESRWGLYHYRLDYPEQDDANWFCHVQLFKDEKGAIALKKRPVDPYVVPVEATQKDAYHRLRIPTPA